MTTKFFEAKVAVLTVAGMESFTNGQLYWNKENTNPNKKRRLLFRYKGIGGGWKIPVAQPHGQYPQYYVPLCLLNKEEKGTLNSIGIKSETTASLIIFSDPSGTEKLAGELADFNCYSNVLFDGHMLITNLSPSIIRAFTNAKTVESMPREILNMMKLSWKPVPAAL